MRILYVSYYAPPYNCMGSVRMAKIVEELAELGHEVVIVAGCPDDLNKDLRELPKSVFIPHFNLRNVARGSKNRTSSNVEHANNRKGRSFGLFKSMIGPGVKLATYFLHNLVFPDIEVFWSRSGEKNIERVVEEISSYDNFVPDIVYASCLPISSGKMGSVLASYFEVPLVFEFRDKWHLSPYRDVPWIRRYFEGRYEERLFKQAQGVVGVTNWLSSLGDKYQIPSAAVLTGISHEKLYNDVSEGDISEFPFLFKNKKTIVYTGMVYPGKRDPSVLIEAFNANEMGISENYQLVFAGKNFAEFEKLNRSDSVFFLGQINRDVALRLQNVADILLLLSWDNEKEKGVVSGKVFEYLEQKKPILHIGCVDGEVAELVSVSGKSVSNDISTHALVDVIDRLSSLCIDLKSLELLSTRNQVLKLDSFLHKVQGNLNGRS